MARREVLRHLLVLSASAAVPALLVGCDKSGPPSCNDVTGLSPDDVAIRNQSAGYAERSADPAKKCSACLQFKPAAPNACGGCTVVKGPINPEGTCKLWVAKS
jgi:hypothetical protein